MLTVRASVESNIAANVKLVTSPEKVYDGIICQNTELGILKFAVYSIRIAMKDAIPIFISCKTGTYDANEIYKLHTVSEHFGNKYAKCAIISASADAIGERLPFLKARAKEMNIEIIENVDMMDDKDLNKTLENLYKNK